MADRVRWGILGTGSIAKQFARGLEHADGAELVAVGSRHADTANAFGEEFDVPQRYPSYEDCVADAQVDIIYVASPHSEHKANTLLALEAGKAVLCEKPFTINTNELREVIAFARTKKLLLMEAMWTRFFPIMVELRQRLADNAIGEVRMVTADFGFRADYEPTSRLFDPAFGGGALLDVGVYPISLSSMILGKPSNITGLATLCGTGVDEQAGMVLGHDAGQLAVLHTSVRTTTAQEAIIYGTEGHIRIHSAWWRPDAMTIVRSGEDDEIVKMPVKGNGYNYEAEEMGRLLHAGKTESAVMTLDESVTIMETLDALRAQWGVKYPME
ncbi:MAG: Gfo/Idh/MocA family oxidoreductase [Candidatus Hydrogenedentes bacterium]|nr:Gfo/Idh/MocA family oxidoreductase [Candidatus Hydrogenedentota bacterium]